MLLELQEQDLLGHAAHFTNGPPVSAGASAFELGSPLAIGVNKKGISISVSLRITVLFML